MYNNPMRRKDFHKRTWLNPTGDCTMTIHVDNYSAQLSIRDCGRAVTIHSDHMDFDLGYKKQKAAFFRKTALIRKMIYALEDEMNERWQ